MSILAFVPLALAAVIVENYILTQFLGIKPFLGAFEPITAITDHPALIVLNCALLAIAVLVTRPAAGFILFAVCYLRAILAFGLLFAMFAGIQRRLAFSAPPLTFKGLPLAVVTAGLMSMVTLGFAGLNVW